MEHQTLILNSMHFIETQVKTRERHGEARPRTPEYHSWLGMIRRCTNSKATGFKHWGGRGISVCDRWRNSYLAFLEDMGRRPSPEHSLDRINNNGNYEPGNCRWATSSEQRFNSRKRAPAEMAPTVCENPICRIKYEPTCLPWLKQRCCSDGCKQQASIIRRAAKLFDPLPRLRVLEILRGG